MLEKTSHKTSSSASSQAEASSASSRTKAWSLVAATTLAMSLSYVDRQTLSVLAPTITKALGISDAAYGWLGAGFSFSYLLAGPLAGVVADRVGARRGLLGGVLLWSAVAGLHAIAPSFAVLFALRLALGIAESPTFPCGAQTIRRTLGPADLPRGMSLLFVGMSLGGMLAPPIAIGLAVRFGWRIAFVGTAALALAWVPLWLSTTSRPAIRDALGGGDRSRTIASELSTMLEVARSPAMLRGLAGLLAIVPASAFAMAWEAKFYVREFALSQAGLASYLVASAIAYDAGAIVFGDLAGRMDRRKVERKLANGNVERGLANGEVPQGAPPRLLLGCGALLATGGLAGLATAQNPHVALACFIASAAGRGAVVTLCNTDTLRRVPGGRVSAAGGVIASVQSLGAIVTNPLLGHAVQGYGYHSALLAIAAWCVPGTLAWLLWPAPRPARD